MANLSAEKMILGITGRLTEVGRAADGMSEIVVEAGRGNFVRVSGLSDETAKLFARSLYMPVTITFKVHHE